MRKMNLSTKLSLFVGLISAFIAIVSSYAVIRIAFYLTEGRIKSDLITKYKQVELLATPSKSTELANFLRGNDLSLLIFNDNRQIVARYGIYRNMEVSATTDLMGLRGYADKKIEDFGNYDIYTEGNIQVATKNDFLSILSSAFGLNLLILSPFVLAISALFSLFLTRLVLSPLTKAESISHELKTPLTRAVSSLQVIEDNSPKKNKSAISKVTQELIQLGGNVDTLLTLSLYKKNNISFHKTSVVASEFAKVANIVPANLRFSHKITADLAIPLSANFTNIILRNLLDNAVKYNKPRGYINFNAKNLNGGWAIEVENSKNVNTGKVGYGLGMTIVKEICHFHKLKFDKKETHNTYKIRISSENLKIWS